jgi:Phospholipase A2-like domain
LNNDDGTPKEWSQPVDRVDQAAYYHDLAYNEYKDTENRNIADREMLQQFGVGLKDKKNRNFQFGASGRPNR